MLKRGENKVAQPAGGRGVVRRFVSIWPSRWRSSHSQEEAQQGVSCTEKQAMSVQMANLKANRPILFPTSAWW